VQMQLTGHAWRFGGFFDIDWELGPPSSIEELRSSGGKITDEEFGEYCMKVIKPSLAKHVKAGDFLVGENGFGLDMDTIDYGHDQEHAARPVMACGIAAVLCDSATPYFYRTSLNAGLLVLEIPGIFAATTTGDELEVDLEAGKVVNGTTGWSATFTKLPDFLLEILEAGGIYNMIESRL
jgi:3-isopropylmalate/(R)-2-methylmalate dehydratase small subunit